MALGLADGRAVVLIRQSAFEKAGLSRSAIDERYNFTDDEFLATCAEPDPESSDVGRKSLYCRGIARGWVCYQGFGPCIFGRIAVAEFNYRA